MVAVHRKQAFKPYLMHEPITFVVETYRREMTDKAVVSATVERVDERRFQAQGRDAVEAFRKMWLGLSLALQESQSWMQ